MPYKVLYNLKSEGGPIEKKITLKKVPEFTSDEELHAYLQKRIAEIEEVPVKHIRITKYY